MHKQSSQHDITHIIETKLNIESTPTCRKGTQGGEVKRLSRYAEGAGQERQGGGGSRQRRWSDLEEVGADPLGETDQVVLVHYRGKIENGEGRGAGGASHVSMCHGILYRRCQWSYLCM